MSFCVAIYFCSYYNVAKYNDVTKKEGGLTNTQHIDRLDRTPDAQSDLDLQHTYKPPNFSTLGLSAHPCVRTLQIIDKHTYTHQHDRPHNTPAPASFIHMQMPAKDTFILQYRLCKLRKHKLSFHLSSQNSRPSSIVQSLSLSLSLSLIFCGSNLIKLPGVAEKVRHLAKVA
jgi:hypothetical protein